MFINRKDAGQQLAQKLTAYKNTNAVVLAVPRGGVPVGYEVARALGLPLEVILSKKIGHPNEDEYAIGAVSLTDSIIESHANVSQEYINEKTRQIRERLQEMYRKFMGDITPVPEKGKILIIVDDGIATGNTLLSTVQMARREQPAKIVVAAPVASRYAVARLRNAADELVCVSIPDDFMAVGQFYEDFDQTEDEEVVALIRQAQTELETKKQ